MEMNVNEHFIEFKCPNASVTLNRRGNGVTQYTGNDKSYEFVAARFLHEVLHIWVGECLLKNNSVLLRDTPDEKFEHKPYYLAEELFAIGLEAIHNFRHGSISRFNKVMPFKTYLEELMPTAYTEGQIEAFIGIGMQLIDTVNTTVKEFRTKYGEPSLAFLF